MIITQILRAVLQEGNEATRRIKAMQDINDAPCRPTVVTSQVLE